MTDPKGICYLNGEYLPLAKACVSVLDRGFLFGDGVYEVIPVYAGKLFRLAQHLERLERSLRAIRLTVPTNRGEWTSLLETLVEHNGGGDLSVYLQVTRGSAPQRDHLFPDHAQATLFAMATPLVEPDPALLATGIAAITVDDIRWRHCHIKAITLLPNLLLRQQAQDAGAGEALLVRDGLVTEGSASNLFMVLDNVLVTPPKTHLILGGITRDLVVELAQANALPCSERLIPERELIQAQELWVTSSIREIMPLVTLNQKPVGDGIAGPVWYKMQGLYSAFKRSLSRGVEAPSLEPRILS